MAAKNDAQTPHSTSRRRPRGEQTGRYLAGQKLTDREIERVVRAFAAGTSASELASTFARGRANRPTANTVFAIYDLLRVRLTEIGYFPDPLSYIEHQETDDLAKSVQDTPEGRLRLSIIEERMRSASERTAPAHAAEAIFRIEHPYHSAAAMFRDIKLAVRITGPLNRPPTNLDVWNLHWLILLQERLIAQLSYELRKGVPLVAELIRASIAKMERELAASRRSLRQQLRSSA